MDVRCQYGLSFNIQTDVFETSQDEEEMVCRAVSKVASRGAHDLMCSFAPRACKWRNRGCRYVGIQQHSNCHEANCDYRIESCHCCSTKIPARNLEKHMELDCPKKAISCLNAKHGCSVEPLRESMEAHLSDHCPFEKVRPFFEMKDAQILQLQQQGMQMRNGMWTRYHGGGQGPRVAVEAEGNFCRIPRLPTLRELMIDKYFIDEITCAICLEILVAAAELLPCRHVFCWGCVEMLPKDHENRLQCPICKVRSDEGACLLPAYDVWVATMDVQCRYGLSFSIQTDMFETTQDEEEIVCRAVLKVESRGAHELTCMFAPRACKWRKWGCRYVGIQQHSNCHEANCDYRIESCPCCSTKIPAKNLEKHMELDCPKKAIPCLNAKHGCSVEPLRESMEAHLSDHCPFEKVKAFFEMKDAQILQLQQQGLDSALF